MSRRRAGRRLLCASAAWSFRGGGRAQGSGGPEVPARGRRTDCPSETQEALQSSPRWPESPSARQVPPPDSDGGPALSCPFSSRAARPVPQVAAAGGRPLPSRRGGWRRSPGQRAGIPDDCGARRRPPSPCSGGTGAGARRARGSPAPRSLPRPPWVCPGVLCDIGDRVVLGHHGIHRPPALFLPWADPVRARAARLSGQLAVSQRSAPAEPWGTIWMVRVAP